MLTRLRPRRGRALPVAMALCVVGSLPARILVLADPLPPIPPASGRLAEERPGERVAPVADAVADLVARARAEGSEALVVLKDGETLVEEFFGHADEPVFAMSVTKSVTALAIAHLVDAGKLELDQPLTSLFPDWDDRDLPPIRVRHLLEHTSGLDTARSHTTGLGVVAHANQSPRTGPPGERFAYNNNACDLLGAVVQPAAGMPLDEYLQLHFFVPMGIGPTSWARDSEGYPKGAGELRIRAPDLAKLGQLMLQGGRWEGRALLSSAAHADLVTPHPERGYVGHLWWILNDFGMRLTLGLLSRWQAAGLSEAGAGSLRPLCGRVFSDREGYLAALRDTDAWPEVVRLDPLFRSGELDLAESVPLGPPVGYSGRGWLGQYLVVLPEHRVVAVRMRRNRPEDYEGPPWADTYPDFEDDVRELAEALAGDAP